MDLPVLRKWGSKALVDLASLIIRTWFNTCRVRLLREDLHKEFFLGDRPFVAVTWHRASIFFCYYYGPFHPVVMFSQSRDGEYLARFAQNCGVIPVRGSSRHGGEIGLIQMIRHLKTGTRICSTVLDGPQGPPYKAKTGLLLLAKKTGVPLLPIIWSSRKPLTLEKTWDKTMIPRPFSQVFIAYGDPLMIPKDCNEREIETWRQIVEDRLKALMVEVDQISGYKTRWN